MTRCRLVAGSFGNLPQKKSVLHGSVAGVATVAGFFISIRKREKKRGGYAGNQPNKFQSAATPATVATALAGTAKRRDRLAVQVATNLQQPATVVSAWR